MIVADTDVLIDYLRGAGQAKRVALELTTRSFATTAVTVFELKSGAHSARQRQAIEAVLNAMTILPLGAEEASLAANLRQKLEAAGQPIGMADYLIAAVCLTHAATLLTRNLKHFERVPGLRISAQK
jgi:tRNA(fMet)-specific endonuclease VapC